MPDETHNSAKPYEAGRVLVPYREARHALGGISAPTLYKMLDKGDLDRVMIGRRVFITAESIARYISCQMSDSVAVAQRGRVPQHGPQMVAGQG